MTQPSETLTDGTVSVGKAEWWTQRTDRLAVVGDAVAQWCSRPQQDPPQIARGDRLLDRMSTSVISGS
jgi:hypothetical protein